MSISTEAQPQLSLLPNILMDGDVLCLEVSASLPLFLYLPAPSQVLFRDSLLQPQGPSSSIAPALEALARQPEDMTGLALPSGHSWLVLLYP